jgi:DNA repair protein RecN (Recombination protein N)
MLASLSIKNYLLIEQIDLNFKSGFSVITGETGAGKSIIIGAISLLLGKRADASVLLDKDSKCVVEASFDLQNLDLNAIFQENELDFEKDTIIRREILSNGKSRAFINDTPVNLVALKNISERLIDLHSQHENLALAISSYRLQIIDTTANSTVFFQNYLKEYDVYLKLKSEVEKTQTTLVQAKKDIDYYKFQVEQIENAKLTDNNELEFLEGQSSLLENAEEIKIALNNSINIISAEDLSIEALFKELKSVLNKVGKTYKPSFELLQRLDSTIIEIRDISEVLNKDAEKAEVNPALLEKTNARIDSINNLLSKHNSANITELKAVYEGYSTHIKGTEEIEEKLIALKKALQEKYLEVKNLAKELSKKRTNSFVQIENNMTKMLQELGMAHAVFIIENIILPDISPSGIDNINFLFSANKSIPAQALEKVASGGEFSRLMLAIKSIVATASGIPTIIFDEIDTGVSGEIANKMGKIMDKISSNCQVISITHLPQVAALGHCHYKVVKLVNATETKTNITELSKDERINEIASMISGEKLTVQAIENAKTLLNR